jgi:predicted MPP superfamily phosphohydrolase
LRVWPVLGIITIQAILLAAHWFIYHTALVFWFPLAPGFAYALRAAVVPLALSFVAAALLGSQFSNIFVRAFYLAASIWLGLVNYFFLAACLCWPIDLALRAAAGHSSLRPVIATTLFGAAILTTIYGLFNALWIRTRRVTVSLPDLPPSWRGRRAVAVSDMHLGNINSVGFARRIVTRIANLNPDIVFIPGDLFDGSGAHPEKQIQPLRELKPPLGVYYATGNHEEFGNPAHYTDPIARAGIRVLNNEKAMVDGVAVLGIPYSDSTFPIRVKATLDRLLSEPGPPAILLLHTPTRLPIVEQAGVKLQLSGHTHGGQFFPSTWLTRRIFGKFTFGLHRFGALTVYTSCGAGTWGPPMRVGTSPELVLITFE